MIYHTLITNKTVIGSGHETWGDVIGKDVFPDPKSLRVETYWYGHVEGQVEHLRNAILTAAKDEGYEGRLYVWNHETEGMLALENVNVMNYQDCDTQIYDGDSLDAAVIGDLYTDHAGITLDNTVYTYDIIELVI